MTDLHELPDEQRERLVAEFSAARSEWGPRARLGRQVDVDQSTIQILEGKRSGPLSSTMVERITQGIGWPRAFWTSVATGAGDWRELNSSTTGQTTADEDLRYRRPEGMGDEQWERIRARGQAYIDGLIDSAAQER